MKEMEIVTSVVAKIGAYLVEPIGQQFGYLIFHKSYIKNVRDQFQRLGVERFELLLRVNAAKRNGEVIAPRVERWIQEVDNINEAVQRILEKEVKAKRMVLKSHYILSRKAKENTLSIDKLLREGKFDIVSYPAPPLGIGPSSLSVEGFKGFESRIKLMKEVLEALRDDKINMIAICGMGGLGKTTMVQEVAKRVKADELFDEVVMAVVSQNQNLSNIQDEIVDSLGLKLDAASLPGRANQLFSRLENSKSVLVILDDIWEAFDLKKVGIPYGNKYKKCKILLTTRFEDACKKMKTQNTSPNEILCEEEVCNEMKIQTFLMKLLSEEEAWNLFKEMVGNCINSPGIGPIAEEVAKECGRLPIAIVTVGSALADKSQVEWSAALQQLKRSISKNIPGLDSKVYSSIELSYNYLKSDEAKSCFLLCCLFPEDCDIPIEYLVRYGVGQRLFAKIDNVVEARNRVHAMVENLKRSFLLLDSKEEECVKMHDVVRDVAISIAEKRGFLVGCNDKMEEWPEQDTYERSAISLVSQELKKHPEGLECPKLELLQLACGKDTWQAFPANLFEGMIRLKVLSLIGMSFPSLPQSIHLLQNIRTLHIHDCEPTDVSAIGALRKLEILSLFGSNIVKLPREIGKLSYLKLLDLSECSNLLQIPPGLLSNLSRLKELYMLGACVNWEPMDGNKEGANASLAELMSLSHRLTALKIHIPNIEVLPKDTLFKNQMIKFQIFVGEKGIYQELSGTGCYLFKNCLALEKTDTSDIVENRALIQLLEKSEILYLKQIKDLKNILYEFDQEGFPCLKVLRVFASEDVEYIIDATSHQSLRAAFPILESLELSDLYNLKEIYHSQCPERSFSNAQLACFGNLRSVRLSECSRLKNVFSLPIARGLVQLQSCIIDWCDDMEEIFAKELEDEHALDKIMFPRLTFIKLYSLQRLIGFCTVIGSIELVHPSMNQKAGRIGSEEVPNFENHNMTDIQQHTTSSRKLFSSMTILWPPNLEDLELAYADSLEVVFDLEGLKLDHDRQRSTVFAQLKTLIVRNLYKLMYMWKNVPQGIQGFQNLTFIDVYECGRLKYLLPPSVAKLLVKLQSIEVRFCDAIQYIVQRDGEEEVADTITFPKLTSFTLRELPSLVSFCTEDFSFEWPSMKKIYLFSCPKLKTFGSEIRHPRKLKKISTGKLDSFLVRDSHGFLGQCFECIPCGGRYDPMVVSSNRGTTNKSQGMSSANKEGTLSTLKDPRFCDTINSPSKMWSLFPSFLIECLKNLETICLWKCHSIEVIFQLEELNVEESHVASLLDQLRKLDLFLLPKLMHIWKKGSKRIMGFGNLRWLEVEKCNSLTYLFSPSIAKLLVMLEEIKVINCGEIEEVLARARKEEEEKDVLFCKVNSILLEDLPNLKCFCTEANAFEWPSLKKMRVIRCPNLKMFVPANLNTPQLEGVYEDFGFKKRRWKGDLNATIKHIFKGKEKQMDNETQQQEKTETSKKNM